MQVVVWGMDGEKGVFVFFILYLCLVSSCEYPLILVLTLASTQLCRLTARFSPALEFSLQTKLLDPREVVVHLFRRTLELPLLYVSFYSRARH